ncbi:MAG TPA: hypothetical protein VN428_11295 [Bryobacteraceae bacterium]|nr:hypothetical protein [Bryobacteraceae bacterium]
MTRRHFTLCIPGALACGRALTAAVRGEDVLYVGGTIKNLPEATEGKLDTENDDKLVFTSDKGTFEIPCKNVTSLEYGQKAGRRVGVALVITVWALFSKKRKHFLTIGYDDAAGKRQGVVLEIAKGRAKTMITIIEARSGKKVEYESEEAKKHVHG